MTDFSRWLRTKVEDPGVDAEFRWYLKRTLHSALNAGIQFDYDAVGIVLLKADDFPGHALVFGIEPDPYTVSDRNLEVSQQLRNETLWRLLLSPHLATLEARFLDRFPVPLSERGKADTMRAADVLAALPRFMFPRDRAAYIARIGARLEDLDFKDMYMLTNVAYRVFSNARE